MIFLTDTILTVRQTVVTEHDLRVVGSFEPFAINHLQNVIEGCFDLKEAICDLFSENIRVISCDVNGAETERQLEFVSFKSDNAQVLHP